MAAKICGPAEGEIDVKRLYLPGIVINDTCPECGAAKEQDLSQEYLSYPSVGIPQKHTLCCLECIHEWSFQIMVEINVKLVEKS